MNPLVRWFHQLGSPPYFDRFAARWTPWCYLAAIVLLGVGLWQALFVAPADYQQGDSFRILYIHVPSAWMSMFVFGLMAFYAAIALVWRIKLCEILAMACAPTGAAFTVITLATGSIWGKPTWGAWWVWDARLTSVLILFLLYCGYIVLRHAFDDHARGSKAGAILLLVGAVNIPIVRFSVDWWHTLHQPASVLRPAGSALAPEMLLPLLVMALAYAFYTAFVVLLRMRGVLMARRIEAAQAG